MARPPAANVLDRPRFRHYPAAAGVLRECRHRRVELGAAGRHGRVAGWGVSGVDDEDVAEQRRKLLLQHRDGRDAVGTSNGDWRRRCAHSPTDLMLTRPHRIARSYLPDHTSASCRASDGAIQL